MSWKLKILVSLLILFIGWIFLAPLLARDLIIEKSLNKADAIVVLSGSSAYVGRTHKAAQIYEENVSRKIILTDDGDLGGWSQIERRNPRFVELAKKELILQGVSEIDIEILKPEVSGTIYEARLINEKIAKEGWTSILLVTSGYHSHRALWTFENVNDSGTVNFGVVSAKNDGQTPDVSTWWFRPSGWRLVVGEYMKFVGYWLFY